MELNGQRAEAVVNKQDFMVEALLVAFITPTILQNIFSCGSRRQKQERSNLIFTAIEMDIKLTSNIDIL